MDVKQLINDKPEYRDIIEKAVDIEDDGEDYWRLEDVGCMTGQITKLKSAGIVETYHSSSNRANYYNLTDLEAVKQSLEEVEQEIETADDTVEFDWSEVEPPQFDNVVGLENTRFIIRRALQSQEQVNILLSGPPALAKSVILRDVEKAVPKTVWAYGGETSSAGLIDKLFSSKPQLVIIDEIDEVGSDYYSILESLGEGGYVSETKFGKDRELQLRNCKVFAAANNPEKLPPAIRSRFTILEMEQYDRDDFLQVVENVLVDQEEIGRDMAEKIAVKVYEEYGSDDIRDAVRLARMAQDSDDVDRLIEALKDHKVDSKWEKYVD